MRRVRDLGFAVTQVGCWDTTHYAEENVRRLREASAQNGVTITSLWAGFPGRVSWTIREGPLTIGLVPTQLRAQRVAAIKAAADFAARLDVPAIATHVGFIPEFPGDPAYPGVVETLRDVASYCRDRGVAFWFETGQETPLTLLRAIEDIGLDSLGINLDPANLILYGRGNPVDALDVFGPYVRSLHAKDGIYATHGYDMGQETPLGGGKVDFPRLLARLKDLAFDGALIIEREIHGPRQEMDIRSGHEYLNGVLDRAYGRE
jgi:sugar phosphate isomerase/epimerase